MAAVDQAALQKVFSKLVDELKAVDIIDKLYEINILTVEEYEGILGACSQASSEEDSKTVNRRVLMAIRRRPPGFAAKLVNILREKHPYRSLANALEKGEWLSMHAYSVVCEVARWSTIEPEWLPLPFIRLTALTEVSSRPCSDPAPTHDPCEDMHPSSSGFGVTSGKYCICPNRGSRDFRPGLHLTSISSRLLLKLPDYLSDT